MSPKSISALNDIIKGETGALMRHNAKKVGFAILIAMVTVLGLVSAAAASAVWGS